MSCADCAREPLGLCIACYETAVSGASDDPSRCSHPSIDGDMCTSCCAQIHFQRDPGSGIVTTRVVG